VFTIRHRAAIWQLRLSCGEIGLLKRHEKKLFPSNQECYFHGMSQGIRWRQRFESFESAFLLLRSASEKREPEAFNDLELEGLVQLLLKKESAAP